MRTKIHWQKIGLFLLLAFGISWTAAGAVRLMGLSLDNPWSAVLVALLYMPGPALAAWLVQRFIYKSRFREYGWAFDRKAWRWLLYTPALFLGLMLLTFGIIALLGNTGLVPQFGRLDFSQAHFNGQLEKLIAGKADISQVNLPDLPPGLLFVLFLVQGIVAGGTVNLPVMFGEEFGWRGLLLHETRPMGFWGSNLFIGLAWGLWHAPMILMGHNYPSNPAAGLLMMCLFTTALCPVFAYVRLKGRSILMPCMLHGMINATGTMFLLYVAGMNEFYSTIAGWAGVIAGAAIGLGIWAWDRPFVRAFRAEAAPDGVPPEMPESV